MGKIFLILILISNGVIIYRYFYITSFTKQNQKFRFSKKIDFTNFNEYVR